MKLSLTSRALGLPLTEGLCTSAAAQAMWQSSVRKPVGFKGRERGTALRGGSALIGAELRNEQPTVLPVIDAVHNYTNALSAHQVRRLLPTP
ncbi:hypothetical protein JNUCC0626_27405 [Lentzea sp. JNUCC 0626]|uniref:hypothetical protein n=1 Tax=Lentzea sp. JNUCC 0626 TaxID=3367513 RepID=UPI00374A34D6